MINHYAKNREAWYGMTVTGKIDLLNCACIPAEAIYFHFILKILPAQYKIGISIVNSHRDQLKL